MNAGEGTCEFGGDGSEGVMAGRGLIGPVARGVRLKVV